MSATTHSSWFATVRVVGLLAVAGTIGWVVSERLRPAQVAERAVKETLAQAADQARDTAERVLRGEPARRTPSTSGSQDAGDGPGSPGDLFTLATDVAHQLSRVGNEVLDETMGLTVDEEIACGQRVHETVVSHNKVLPRRADLRRIERLAAPLLDGRSRQQIHYRFWIIQDDEINAFAHIGGHVYVTSGLLAAARDDDELRFILAHEIAHSDLRHCAQGVNAMVRAEQLAGDVGGMLAGVAYRAIAVGYSEDLEYAADLWAYQQMIRAGRSHDQALAGLRLLDRHYGDRERAHSRSDRGSLIDQINNHLRTHPPIQERITRLQQQHNSSRSH